MLKDSNVLITGGTGTIGKLLIKEVIKHEPKLIKVLDNDETRLFELEQEFGNRKLQCIVGDLRDKDSLYQACQGIDIVFHLAAMKNVHVCESNPNETVKVNVVGMQNVINASVKQGVKNFIFTSSDKAVNPTNIMGMTKLIGEKLITEANTKKVGTKFSSVRFGNVLGSRGSVIPTIKNR